MNCAQQLGVYYISDQSWWKNIISYLDSATTISENRPCIAAQAGKLICKTQSPLSHLYECFVIRGNALIPSIIHSVSSHQARYKVPLARKTIQINKKHSSQPGSFGVPSYSFFPLCLFGPMGYFWCCLCLKVMWNPVKRQISVTLWCQTNKGSTLFKKEKI